jgi:hypothetical protein
MSTRLKGIDAAEAVSRDGRDGSKPASPVITLSSGVKLRCKPIPPWLIADVINEWNDRKPKIPVYLNPEKGREEENPADPNYQKALDDWNIAVAMELNNALILMGTEVIEVPEGFPSHEDREWTSKMQAMGRLSDNPHRNYLYWIKYTAAPKMPEDIELIIREVGRLSGVREEDVQAAVGSFRPQGS